MFIESQMIFYCRKTNIRMIKFIINFCCNIYSYSNAIFQEKKVLRKKLISDFLLLFECIKNAKELVSKNKINKSILIDLFKIFFLIKLMQNKQGIIER